jgi:hypothetical protein
MSSTTADNINNDIGRNVYLPVLVLIAKITFRRVIKLVIKLDSNSNSIFF